MRTKLHNASNLKVLIVLILVFLALYALTLSPPRSAQELTPAIQRTPCERSKIPPSLASTLVHYTTSNVIPQQSLKEISVTARVLQKRSPCNFLVFGLGHDSPMWSALNHGGRTVFLEEDESWIRTVARRFPALESYIVRYDTTVGEAEGLLALREAEECVAVGGDARVSGCPLAVRGLPSVFYEVEWDLIMVDAPTGYFAGAPGRMGAIYSAGMAARGRTGEGETDVFVHDVDRVVEDKFSRAFLCEGYLREQEGKLRHFRIPSHRANPASAFCPPTRGRQLFWV